MLGPSSKDVIPRPTDDEKTLLEYTYANSLKDIETLSLANLGLNDETVNFALLSTLTRLKALDLSGNKLTRLELQLPSLTKLIVTGNRIASVDHAHLHTVPNLQSLSVLNNAGLSSKSAPYEQLKASSLKNLVEYNGKRWNSDVEETCIVCGEPEPAEDMICCDGCGEYYHINTCDQETMAIPEGDYFCRACKRADSETTSVSRGRTEANDADGLKTRLALAQMLRVHGVYPSTHEFGQQQVWGCDFMPLPATRYHGVPEGSVILATCGGNSVCMIDIADGVGRVIHKFVHDGDDFGVVVWTKLPMRDSAEVPVLLAGGESNTLKLYRPDIKCFASLQGHKGSIDSISVHPKRPNWVLAGGKKAITLFELADHSEDGPDGEAGRIICQWGMEFSINSLTFVEGSEEKGQRFERFFVVGPTGRICSIKVPLNDDGTVHVKHINDDGHRHMFSGDGFYCINTLKQDDKAIDHSIDQIVHVKDSTVATKSANDARILLWDYEIAGKPRNISNKRHLKGILNYTCDKLFQLHGCISPDGSAFLCGDAHGNIKVFDLTDLHGIEPSFPIQMWSSVHPECQSAIRNIAMSSDSRYVAAVNQSNLVMLFCVG